MSKRFASNRYADSRYIDTRWRGAGAILLTGGGDSSKRPTVLDIQQEDEEILAIIHAAMKIILR